MGGGRAEVPRTRGATATLVYLLQSPCRASKNVVRMTGSGPLEQGRQFLCASLRLTLAPCRRKTNSLLGVCTLLFFSSFFLFLHRNIFCVRFWIFLFLLTPRHSPVTPPPLLLPSPYLQIPSAACPPFEITFVPAAASVPRSVDNNYVSSSLREVFTLLSLSPVGRGH